MHNSAMTPGDRIVLQLAADRRIRAVTEDILSQYQLTATDWLLLRLVQAVPSGLRMSEIAQGVQVALPLITRLVQAHVEAGLLVIRLDASDRRAKPVVITKRGTALTAQVQAELDQLVLTMEHGVGVRQLEAYYKTLLHITRHL